MANQILSEVRIKNKSIKKSKLMQNQNVNKSQVILNSY